MSDVSQCSEKFKILVVYPWNSVRVERTGEQFVDIVERLELICVT